MYPFVKTGGLADVVGALPAVLRNQGIEVTSLIPGYRSILPSKASGDLVTIAEASSASGLVLAANIPAAFDRAGGPYLDEQGKDYADNLVRFSAFAQRGGQLLHLDLVQDQKIKERQRGENS